MYYLKTNTRERPVIRVFFYLTFKIKTHRELGIRKNH